MRPNHEKVAILCQEDRRQQLHDWLTGWGFRAVDLTDEPDLVIFDGTTPLGIPLGSVGSPPSIIFLTHDNDSDDGFDTLPAGTVILPTDLAPLSWQSLLPPLLDRRRLMQREKRQQQWTQIGKITTGLLHALKGPIHNVVMSAEKLQESNLSSNNRWLEILDRNSQLLRDSIEHLLQGFGDRRHQQIEDLVPLLGRALLFAIESCATEHQIEIDQQIELDSAPVLAPPGHLLHLLLNLINNAREAIGQGPGTIHIRLARADAQRFAIIIADTGPGLAPEVLQRWGEPFLTTKPDGTGLGLSLALRIIRECGGEIQADSPPAGGSRFTLLLPVAPESAG
jgi:signal transduction histidine kinase